MLDTIRAYCLERLAEAEEEDGVRDRMCGYYLALAETADPLLRTRAQRPWFGVLAAESGNMQAALRWATGRGDAGTALRLAAALAWFWYLCGQRGDCAALARAALVLDAAGSRREDRATAEVRGVCAVVAASAGLGPGARRVSWWTSLSLRCRRSDGGRRTPWSFMPRRRPRGSAATVNARLRCSAATSTRPTPGLGAAARMQSAVILRGLGRIEEASLGCDAALAAFRDIQESWGTARP